MKKSFANVFNNSNCCNKAHKKMLNSKFSDEKKGKKGKSELFELFHLFQSILTAKVSMKILSRSV